MSRFKWIFIQTKWNWKLFWLYLLVVDSECKSSPNIRILSWRRKTVDAEKMSVSARGWKKVKCCLPIVRWSSMLQCYKTDLKPWEHIFCVASSKCKTNRHSNCRHGIMLRPPWPLNDGSQCLWRPFKGLCRLWEMNSWLLLCVSFSTWDSNLTWSLCWIFVLHSR